MVANQNTGKHQFLFLQVKKHVPNLVIEYKVDSRQAIADAWPMVRVFSIKATLNVRPSVRMSTTFRGKRDFLGP